MKWVIPRLIPLDRRQETSCGAGNVLGGSRLQRRGEITRRMQHATKPGFRLDFQRPVSVPKMSF